MITKKEVKAALKEVLQSKRDIEHMFESQRLAVLAYKDELTDDIKETICPVEEWEEFIDFILEEIEKNKISWKERMDNAEYLQAIKNLLDDRSKTLKYDFWEDAIFGTKVLYLKVLGRFYGAENICTEEKCFIKELTYIVHGKPIYLNNNALNDEEKLVLSVFEEIENKIQLKIREMVKERKKTKYKQEQLTTLFSEELTISLNKITQNSYLNVKDEKALISTLDLTKEILNNEFKVNKQLLNENELILKNNLNEQDINVLETIVLTIFGQNGKRIFTDREVAIYLTKSKSSDTVSNELLKSIDESINKLQKTDIRLGIESDASKITKKNPLIWLKEIDVTENESSTKYYEIIDTPFYYDYAKTSPLKLVDRELIYLNGEKESQKTTLNKVTCKLHLIRRIESLEYMPKVNINFSDIYGIYNCTKESYKGTDKALAKAQERARNRCYSNLKALQEEYKLHDNKIQFIINVKKIGNRQVGYILRKKI